MTLSHLQANPYKEIYIIREIQSYISIGYIIVHDRELSRRYRFSRLQHLHADCDIRDYEKKMSLLSLCSGDTKSLCFFAV